MQISGIAIFNVKKHVFNMKWCGMQIINIVDKHHHTDTTLVRINIVDEHHHTDTTQTLILLHADDSHATFRH